ncbi:MAG: glycosyl hydrolase [Verrucomicrobiota bacterium]|nr:glycosyl hydrolase [Verrucomicrobiota bacterium]
MLHTTDADATVQAFAHAPQRFGVIPFWFWNDRLDLVELLKQLADFDAHGVAGVVIHPRIGLPFDQSWMSPALLQCYRVVCADARKRGLTVILYDEGMYPSGSACGRVVGENAEYAARGFARIPITKASGALSELPQGHEFIATIKGTDGSLLAVIEQPLGSHVRGLHYENEDAATTRVEPLREQCPPAADLLNPNAVEAFIRHSYESFYEALHEYFGDPITAIFTDEPSLLGRLSGSTDFRAGTKRVLDAFESRWGYDFRPHLGTLWENDQEKSEHRLRYEQTLQECLATTYYKPLYEWCEHHGVALVGHPERPDDYTVSRYFHIPGQDIVWRWVMPDSSSAIEGAQSTQAKCAASAAAHRGRSRNANEFAGAFGHELTFEEFQWLANWLLVRGCNMLIPHAFYYSMRGPRRDERPPDVGPNCPWWEQFTDWANAMRRICWLNATATPEIRVAVLGTVHELPWRVPRDLFQSQTDFHYILPSDIKEAEINAQHLALAGYKYEVVVSETTPDAETMLALKPMAMDGRFITADETSNWLEKLHSLVPPSVALLTPIPALRVRKMHWQQYQFTLLFNECIAPITCQFTLPLAKGTIRLNPRNGQAESLHSLAEIHLAGHELMILAESHLF